MKADTRGRTLRLFSTAIVDQVMLSGTSFLVGFILIRFTSDFDYGLYVLIQSALLLLVSAQGSLIGAPLAAVVPKKPPEERRAMIGAVTAGQRRVLLYLVPVALLLTLLGFLLGRYDTLMAVVLACAVMAAWGGLRRDYLRSILLIYQKPHQVLWADVLYVIVLLAGVLGASLLTHSPIIWATIALAAALWAGTLRANRSLAKDPGWVPGDKAAAWRELRILGLWSMFGSVMYWLFGQSYSYMLATRLDLKSVAAVNEARLLLMPAFVLTIGMQGLLTPMAAKWYADLGFRTLVRRLLAILGIVGTLDLLYFGFVWIFRDWLVGDLMHKHIIDRDELLLLWAIVAIIGLMRDVLQCTLLALAKFRSTASQVAYSAVVALVIMWFGMSWWGAPAVLIGQIVGEVVNVIGIVLLMRKLARQHASTATSASG